MAKRNKAADAMKKQKEARQKKILIGLVPLLLLLMVWQGPGMLSAFTGGEAAPPPVLPPEGSTDTTGTGDGTALNVRALYQRCPHLGCKPNQCLRNFWLECPCHGSRYDRLGIKAAGAQYGPAPRSMDRFAASVDSGGVLTLDTGRITLGPLPIAVGQPGIIPPTSPVGCI